MWHDFEARSTALSLLSIANTPRLRCWQHTETIDDRSLPEGPGDYAQVLPHRIALGPL
jgi:hypothetical protein